jgi:hypothetical protein
VVDRASVAFVLGLLAAAAGVAGCGPRAAPARAVAANASGKPGAPVDFVTPSLLLPDVVGTKTFVGEEGGARRVLVDRMRVIARDDGSLERAPELLPSGAVHSVALPTRFGGGFLFHAMSGGSTHVWRAPSWLAKLEPLAEIGYAVDSISPGLDRLIVKISNGTVRAIDPTTGAPVPVAPLPTASGYGALVFADGWRGVADVDLRGLLATFDAGATWRPLGIREKVLSVGLVSGNPIVHVSGGSYVVDERGGVTFRATPATETMPDVPEPSAPPLGPLGRRPLRAALEDGWPDSLTTAVVARAGALVRVSLKDGAVLATNEDAYPEHQAACHAVRLGASFGFVCGERDGATAIYAYAPPLDMKPALRFSKPRFVTASGNGALVVRGACADDAPPLPDARPYCIRAANGATREVRLKGDVGVERVVALADRRVAVLVPPHAGGGGQLILLGDGATKSIALKLPTEPKNSARELHRGMWLDGFEERAHNVLSGWVEAGGATVGVTVALDGTVLAGELRDDPGGVIVSGRFAFSIGEGGRAAESTDGGTTFRAVDLPERDEASVLATPTRACGPAGCALGGWLRVGWGKAASAEDLQPATPPKWTPAPLHGVSSLPFVCEVVGSVTPPPPDASKPAVAAPTPPTPPARSGRHLPPPTPVPPHTVSIGVGAPPAGSKKPTSQTLTPWTAFRNLPPPALGADELGIDNGTQGEAVQLRAYAWGKKGADWTRAARWLVRFDDRFDGSGGIRSSAITASPWIDENIAGEAIGVGNGYQMTRWQLHEGRLLDPSGHAALAAGCRNGSNCALYAVVDGQPVQPLRDVNGHTPSVGQPQSAVRVGETWFFEVLNGQEQMTLYRVDLGVVRLIATWPRPAGVRVATPLLVHRARSNALGVLVDIDGDPRVSYGSWAVLPVNQETGELGEPVLLVRKDFGGKLARCSASQDGWLADVDTPIVAPVDLVGAHAALGPLELRLRLDPGFACVESMASRVDGVVTKGTTPAEKAAKTPPPPPIRIDEATAIPLSVTEQRTNRRWSMRCMKKG